MKRKWVKDLLLAIALLFAVVTWGFAGWELGEMAGLNRARQECAQDLTKMLEAEKVSCPVCGEKSGQATQN